MQDALKPLQQAAASNKPNTSVLLSAVQRVSNLASITDPVELFERAVPGNKRSSTSSRNIEEYLRTLLIAYQDDQEEAGEQILLSSMQALLLYSMWKVKHACESLEAGDAVEWDLSPFATSLTTLIEARSKLDDVRLAAIGVFLDAYTAQLILRQIDAEDQELSNTINNLVVNVPAAAKKAITASFVAAEKEFAKKTRKNLDTSTDDADGEGPDVNGEPEAPESEPEESESEDEVDDQQRKHEALRSERRLCELTGKIVLAIVGKVLDAEAPGKGKLRRRIQKNRTKLGPHFKEVLGYLDEPKAKASRTNRAKTPAQTNGARAAAPAKSKEVIEDSDDDEEEEQGAGGDEIEDGVEGDEEDLRRKGVVMDKDDIVDDDEEAGAADVDADEIEDEVMDE